MLEFWVIFQVKVVGYRVDFLVWFCFNNVVVGVVVECDGYVFYEKIKEQVVLDKKCDCVIVIVGFFVLRFMGSEIYRDVVGCVEQVKEMLFEFFFKVFKEGGFF